MKKNPVPVVVLLALTVSAFAIAAGCASSGGGGSAASTEDLPPSQVLAMTGGRPLMCVNPAPSDLGPELDRSLFQCEPGWNLENCAYDFLGNIRAERTGAGVDVKEMLENFQREATRIGGDAILNVRLAGGGGRSIMSGAGSDALFQMRGEAVRLKDPTCRVGGEG